VKTRKRAVAITALGLAAALTLSGCANDEFAQQYAADADQGYVSGDGSWEVFPADQRDAPVEFSGPTESGDTFSSSDYEGDVIVVNFWYAACPPCRIEAEDLQATSAEYADDGVQFVGVNVYDQAATAQSFADEFGITYPSILDVEGAEVRLAFADNVSPQAIPSTLVLDRTGAVAAVIRGVADPSVLSSMIDDALAE
jgi:peroxiredoxin